MRYSEFKREVDALSSNYVVRKELANIFDEDIISVWYKEQPIMKISGTYQFVMQKFYLMDSTPFSHKLYMLAAELAMTPIEERNDPEKYYVHVVKNRCDGYLNLDRADLKKFCIGFMTDNFRWQSAFKKAEIDELKVNPDLAIDWDKVSLEKVSD